MRFYRVVGKTVCYGVFTDDKGIITDGAPIVKKHIGKHINYLQTTFRVKLKRLN